MSIKKTEWSITSQLIVDEAKNKNYKVNIINKDLNFFSILYKKHIEYFKVVTNSKISFIAGIIANDKIISYKVLKNYKIMQPKTLLINKKTDLNKALEKIKFPVVIKPHNGTHGKNVFVNIKTKKEVFKCLDIIKKSNSKCLLQEMVKGNDYRLLVVNNKFIAGALRNPAYIIGDGVNTIKKLITIENKNPLRGGGHTTQLTKITIDKIVTNNLRECNLSLNSIPKKNKIIYLRKTANTSTGGTVENITKKVNKKIIKQIEKISKDLKAGVMAFDIITIDISKTLESTKGVLIEINALPGLRMHHFPLKVRGINVSKKILEMLFK